MSESGTPLVALGPEPFLRWVGETAREAAVDLATLRWDRRALRDGELPDELLREQRFVLIYLLPRLFQSQGAAMASYFASFWQYGESRIGKLISSPEIPSRPFWRYPLSAFKGSRTLMAELDATLAGNVEALKTIGAAPGKTQDLWKGLLRTAEDIVSKRRGEENWEQPVGDYGKRISNPQIPLAINAISELNYAQNLENPLQSDAFKAVGNCVVRSYVMGKLAKRKGDPGVYFKPERVGARLWDDYDFRDSATNRWLEMIAAVFGARESQPLGLWRGSEDRTPYLLQNADFQDYRAEFMPKYNAYVKKMGNGKPLTCTDFHSFSEYKEVDVQGIEYKLF